MTSTTLLIMNKLEIITSKIVPPEMISGTVAQWKFKTKKIVFTNGCFDILHLGHVEYLAKAASLGDVLVIGLNSDHSVRTLKGNKRPINNEQARATILASIGFVNAVILFDEETPYQLIQKILPDILVKGNDYQVENIVGHDIVSASGGSVVTIDLTPGYSTTSIEQKILDLNR
jgi:D-glycero-beta-D-manno-heptose 1-phosphate adenylyltransferase